MLGPTCVDAESLLILKFQITYCYWPPRAGASAKVKREEIPDKETWNVYEIRIFSFASMRLVFFIFLKSKYRQWYINLEPYYNSHFFSCRNLYQSPGTGQESREYIQYRHIS